MMFDVCNMIVFAFAFVPMLDGFSNELNCHPNIMIFFAMSLVIFLHVSEVIKNFL